jgi:AraC-like DNA-binding protein
MEKIVHLLIMYTMLVLTLLLFHKGRKHPRSLMLALYASVEVITNGLNSLTLSAGWTFFDRFPFSHFIYKPIYCLWVPLFYFYFRSVLSSDFRIAKKSWPHFLPAAFFFLFFLSVLIFKGNHYIWENLYQKNSFVFNINFAVDVVVKVQYVFYIFLMFRSLRQTEKARNSKAAGNQAAEVDIRWSRFIVYGYAAGAFGAITIFVANWMNSPATSTINIVSISYYFLFFFAIFYNTITHKSYENEGKPKGAIIPDTEMQRLMEKVDTVIMEKEMYLAPDLTLQQLALAVSEKDRSISQAINTIKKQNVNEYINSLRIEHACRLLLAQKEKPVFEVMYESGFSTKGAFNLTFKKITGKTPTQFRQG